MKISKSNSGPKSINLLIAWALLILLPNTSLIASERTVCFRLKIRDDRYNCADLSETGNRRGCNAGGYVYAVGHQVELWDKDDDGNDEYIGTWYLNYSGTNCITFEWENASYSKGERDPDLYLRYINRVNKTGFTNYIYVRATDEDGDGYGATSWRNGKSGDADRYVSRNCSNRTTCNIFPSGSLVPTNDVASTRGLYIMAIDAAQHTLQVFGEIMSRNVNLRFPGKSSCPTSCATDRGNFHISGTQGGDGILVGHELGHVIQMQQFGKDDLRNDCSKNGGGWNLTSDEWESCATQEGFASFIGIVSWYEPNNAGTVPFGWGLDFESATPDRSPCSANKGSPLQVAKAFWDMDDWNDEAGAGDASSWNDDLAYSTTGLAKGWAEFEGGTDNREDNESGRDGVNMRDYYSNNTGRYTSSSFFETFIRHNCLEDQTND